jgi:peroxiredoxin
MSPCIREVATLNQFAASHPEINSLAITFDSPAIAREFSKKYGLDWKVAADAQGYINAVAVTSYPTLLVANANG